DFAILAIGRYDQARADGESHQQAIATSVAKLGRAVFFGALTTAVGFLALVLSGAMSFAELGVLIAIGIFVAGLLMCSILFLFVREDAHRAAGFPPARARIPASGEFMKSLPAGETPAGLRGAPRRIPPVADKIPVLRRDWLFDLVTRYVRWIVRRPAPMLAFS